MLAAHLARLKRRGAPVRYALDDPIIYIPHEHLHLQEDAEQTGTHNLHALGQLVGGISVGHPGGDNRVAERMFPGVLQPGQVASRTHGIDLDERLHGAGLGQLLYLHALLHGGPGGGPTHLYNSQTEPPATNALLALMKKGLVQGHWKPYTPGYNREGGVHLIGATPQGEEAYNHGSILKLAQLAHLLQQLRGS